MSRTSPLLSTLALTSSLGLACVASTTTTTTPEPDSGTSSQPGPDADAAALPETSTTVDAATPDVAPPPWSPKSLSGLSLWLRATDGLHFDANDYVTAWDDQSGNNNTAMPTANAAPKHTLYAGQDAVLFSSKQALQMNDSTSLRWAGDFTVVVVAASNQPGMTYGMLYGKSLVASPYAGPALMVDYPMGQKAYSGAIGGQVDIADAVVSTESGLDDFKARAFGLTRSSSALELRVNGGAAATQLMANPPQDTTATGAIAWVGGHPANGGVVQGFEGVILEVIGVDGAVSDPEYAQIWTYASQRYGL